VKYPECALKVSFCEHCEKQAIWWNSHLVFPDQSAAPPPVDEMPENIRKDFQEAAAIVSRSPRGAAALLRLAVQKLCVHLGERGENLNSDISALVKKGLPPKLQRSLDIVRVIGNNAVHPGQIATDDETVALQLFPLVNLIVESMISIPERIAAVYEELPDTARAAIEERDGTAE
jgi:hypothetical protein